MSAIQEIFQRYAPQYLQLYGQSMPSVHKKVISAIENCRGGGFGSLHYACPYFMITFTVPQQLRRFIRSNPFYCTGRWLVSGQGRVGIVEAGFFHPG